MSGENETNAQAIVEVLGNRSPADAVTMLARAIRGYCEGSDRVAAGFETDDMVRLVQKRLGDD